MTALAYLLIGSSALMLCCALVSLGQRVETLLQYQFLSMKIPILLEFCSYLYGNCDNDG